MNPDPTRADRVCRVFCNVVDGVVTTRALKQSCGDELSRAQFVGLQFILLHPSCCIKDLAQGLAVSHPAAVKLVERLTAKGLIVRSAHETDKRMVELAVTKSGQERARAVMALRSQAIMDILAATSPECACRFLDCLEGFIGVALADGKDVDGVCLHCGGYHADDCPVCQAELALTGHLRTDS